MTATPASPRPVVIERRVVPFRLVGATWSDVRDVGRVVEDEHRSGKKRWRIYFGRRDWWPVTVRISKRDGALGWKPFSSQDQALEMLSDIRGELAAGKRTLRQILLPYLAPDSEDGRVEVRVAGWLLNFQQLVDIEDRSPATLREYRRYAALYFPPLFDLQLAQVCDRDLKAWNRWLASEPANTFGPNTRKKILAAFRACMTYWADEGEIETVPRFPAIKVPAYAAQIMGLDERERAFEEIPWERRGAFLFAASEGLRLSEFRAYRLDDWQKPRLRMVASIQGAGREQRRVEHNKNNTAEWREPWDAELIRWLDWRLEQATPESRARGELALFWNPSARNALKMWSTDPLEKQWHAACRAARVAPIPFGEATRHTTFTALGDMGERMLRAFTRHKDLRSLDKYTKQAKGPSRDALVVRLRPKKGET